MLRMMHELFRLTSTLIFNSKSSTYPLCKHSVGVFLMIVFVLVVFFSFQNLQCSFLLLFFFFKKQLDLVKLKAVESSFNLLQVKTQISVLAWLDAFCDDVTRCVSAQICTKSKKHSTLPWILWILPDFTVTS